MTPAGKEYAGLDSRGRKQILGSMLANVDEAWLGVKELRELFGQQFNETTLEARITCFTTWGEAAREHLINNGVSEGDVEAYAQKRKEEAQRNCPTYNYNTFASTGTRTKEDPLAKRSDEVLCEHCFMYRPIRGGCRDMGQCGR